MVESTTPVNDEDEDEEDGMALAAEVALAAVHAADGMAVVVDQAVSSFFVPVPFFHFIPSLPQAVRLHIVIRILPGAIPLRSLSLFFSPYFSATSWRSID